MIIVHCDRCINIQNARMNIRTERETFIIECLECGDMKRFVNKEIKE